jgi:hypothetical protein
VGQGQGRPRPLERDLVRSGVDQEEEVSLLHVLVVSHVKLDDVPAHLRSDSHEVCAHGGVIGLRPRLPLQQGHDDRDGGGPHDAGAQQPSHRATQARRWRHPFVGHEVTL